MKDLITREETELTCEELKVPPPPPAAALVVVVDDDDAAVESCGELRIISGDEFMLALFAGGCEIASMLYGDGDIGTP